MPSFKLAERCCFKNQWGSNGRNVPVDSSKEYLEEVDHADPTMEAGFESVCDSVSWKADRKLAYGLVKNTLYFCTGQMNLPVKIDILT